MFDETERLCEDDALFGLLDHYARAAVPDRQAWHPRLARLGDVGGRALTRLYGELLAYGWLETRFESSACYRASAAGLRAHRNCERGCPEDAEDAPVAAAPACVGGRGGEELSGPALPPDPHQETAE